MTIGRIKTKISEKLDDFKIFLIKSWFSFYAFITRLYFPLRRSLLIMFLTAILSVLCYIAYKYYGVITSYLAKQNNDSQGHTSGFFPSLFTAIGASCLGVLAITFSLSLFAIQQAADKHTPTVLINFLKDPKNNIIFWSIGFIALVFFVFSIVPLDVFIFWEVLFTFVFLILILYLLKKQYAHITRLVNPLHQITFHHDEAIHSLKKIDKWLDLMIRIKAVQPAPQGNEENEI